MQYGRIPTQTYGRNWQGPRSFEAQWVWLWLASHGWLGSSMDPHVRHGDQWCSPGNGSNACRRSIFPSWRIACAVAGCAEPAEYAASVRPKSYCKLESHRNTPLKNYWWMDAGYRPSSSWKWLEHLSNQRSWPTIQKGLPLTWRWSSIHLSILLGPGGSQTSDQSYWSIWPPWVYQGGRRFRESGTNLWLWFYSEPNNQCKVTRFHISSVPTRLGSYKVMRWDRCAPHSLTESENRLSHWEAVHWGSDRRGA